MKTPVTFMLRIRFTCSERLLKAVKGNKQEACGCSLFLNFLLCQRKVTVNVAVFCHTGILFFVSHNLFKTWKWVLHRSTLMPLTDVGGCVWVWHGRVATRIRLLTALWSSPARSYTASNSVWFVVKQTASDLEGGGGGCIHSASPERQRRECQPASADGVAQRFWPLCFWFWLPHISLLWH